MLIYQLDIEKSATETTRLLNWLKEIEHDMQIFHYPEVYVYVHTNFAIDFLLDFQNSNKNMQNVILAI